MIPENNDEIAALKNQMFILLVALIVVSGTLTVVLYRQASLANKDISDLQRLSDQTTTNEMVLRNLVDHLINFGEKDLKYQAVLKKNGFTAPVGTPAAAPAAPKK
ncbi:MAG: hypothetical protein ABSH48_05280 [Verrucomicrobiota bacterium]|jgi:hypothetical protein